VQRGDASGDSARAIEKALHEAISIPGRSLSDELVSVENKLVAWVVDEDGGGKPPPPPPVRTIKGDATLSTADDVSDLVAKLQKAIKQHGKEVHVHWWVD
jgi:hypothetical protein